MKVGDLVLFIPFAPLPVPRGKMRMWDIGRIICLHRQAVEVVDVCKRRHFVYTRMVRVLVSLEEGEV